ncbi:hypothetical protein AB0E88_32440 [Streptomyces sp. NPDC028635]|uniref:hypothetical protein n=1 Tax=Streptomyces sp. NPDC028635 TaxID=3154800 RepID=UPI003408D245
MNRGSRILTALHAAVGVWLVWCTVRTWGAATTWISVIMAAAAATVLAGVVRPLVADRRRAGRERDGRRGTRHVDAAEALARRELSAACCERWWTSLGADHDTACGRRAHRSAA